MPTRAPVSLVFLSVLLLLSAAPRASAQSGDAPPAGDALKRRIDATLDHTFARKVTLQDNAAWQILHGVLAFQREFLVEDEQGRMVSVVDHLLGGGAMRGWDLRPGDQFDNGRQGLRAMLDAGSKAGQGHTDQWFGYMAQCDLPVETEIHAAGRTFQLADFIDQIKYDAPRNFSNEYSWTLVGLSKYLPTNVVWRAADGEEWSLGRMLDIELSQTIDDAACGGTHRLIGIASVRNRRQADRAPLTDVWQEADQLLNLHIERARELQNPDGSFSINYFVRPGTSPDLAQNLGATGHILEFIALSAPVDRLDDPWVRRAVVRLCDLLDRTRQLPLECGALYHAAHGLTLYRERVFGARKYGG